LVQGKSLNSKGLLITAYLNALWSFGMKLDSRDKYNKQTIINCEVFTIIFLLFY